MEFVQRKEGTVAVMTDALGKHNVLEAIYEAGSKSCINLAVAKEQLPEDFFALSTGIAGEILQKFSTYCARLAIYGDFAGYRSEPLQAFIRESNRGNTIFFTATKEQAIDRLLALKRQ